MFFHSIPALVKFIHPNFLWNGRRDENTIYLTFDDGPVPGVTDFVLAELQKRNMKATFFMVGENILKHPALAQKALYLGNNIGNHTHNHLKGTDCSLKEYVDNFQKCQQTIRNVLGHETILFRPPYGRINKSQKKAIKETHKIVMWETLAGDFRRDLNPLNCLRSIKRFTRNGSIILFHDQEKTVNFLQLVLPDYLDYINEKGWDTGLI